jgi:hypothetical protein
MPFAAVFVLVVPALARFLPQIGERLAGVFPIMPLGAAAMVIVALLIDIWGMDVLNLLSHLFPLPSMSGAQVDEIARHAYAFALMVAGILCYVKKLDQKQKEDDEAFLKALTSYRR